MTSVVSTCKRRPTGLKTFFKRTYTKKLVPNYICKDPNVLSSQKWPSGQIAIKEGVVQTFFAGHAFAVILPIGQYCPRTHGDFPAVVWQKEPGGHSTCLVRALMPSQRYVESHAISCVALAEAW